MHLRQVTWLASVAIIGTALHGCSSGTAPAATGDRATGRQGMEGLSATSSSGPGLYHLSDNASGLSVDAALLGVSSVPPRPQPDGSVVFPGAYGGYDLVERTTRDGVEDYIVFASAPALARTDYTVTPGPTVRGLRLVDNVLEFLDAGGVPRIRITPPYITGADGVTSTATLSLDGCAHDSDVTPPWTRAPVAPGAATCALHVSWADQPVVYPATLDPSWTWTGLMVRPRSGHVAVALPDGDVLVAGGENDQGNGGSISSAELYSAKLGKWTPVAPMLHSRTQATAVALPDGRILVAGGLYKRSSADVAPSKFAYALCSAEIFDPSIGLWFPVDSLQTARYQHAAVAFSSGVLVCGGTDGASVLASCEQFGSSFTPAPGMLSARAEFTLTASGSSVLAAGGRGSAGALGAAEVLQHGAWGPASALATARYGHVAALLRDGSVLVAGGQGTSAITSAERYSFSTNAWTTRSAALASGPSQPGGAYRAAACTANGLVAVTGGGGSTANASTATYDGVGDVWAPGASLQQARYAHTATALPGGVVLVAGGLDARGHALGTSEVLPLRQADGLACSTAADCASGFCADGVCCDTACTDVCGACALPGAEGLCSPTSAPHNGSCAGSGACAGTCSGQLGCSYPASEATCAQASCNAGQAVAAATCDGAGQCLPQQQTACNAYACGPGACKTSCASRADCASTRYWCSASQCRLDTVPPAFALANLTAEATSAAGAVVSYAPAAADDADGVVPATCTPPPGSTFALGGTPVRCSASDLAGNAGAGAFTVMVQDTTPPALSLPQAITAEATGASGASVTYAAAAQDLVAGAVGVVCDQPSGWVFPLGTTTVHCSADDVAGNHAAGAFDVTVVDTTPPAMTLPGPLTAQAVDAHGANVTFAPAPTATDLVDGEVAVTCTPASGSLFALDQVVTVSCSASDAHQNSATGTFTVAAVDQVPPRLTLPRDLTAEATSAAGADVVFTASALDAVDGPDAVTCTRGAETLKSTDAGFGSVAPYHVDETVTIGCSAADRHGNAASGQFTVKVVDTMPPAIVVPTDVVAEATGPAGAAVSYTASASDLVDGAVAPTCLPAPGSTFAIGSTTVTCTASDAHGNTSSRSFLVRVNDTTAPILALPSSFTVEAAGPEGAVVEYTASGTDVVAGAQIPTCYPVSGSLFPVGQTTVSCSAADTSGNAANGAFVVTVADTTPPALTLPADITVAATSASGAAVTFSAAATDLVDGALGTTCQPASGATFPVGTTAVACSATDAHGNTGTRAFDVTVTSLAKPYNLNVRVLAASGSVGGGGLDCTNNAGTCAAVEAGPVTLTAYPASGYNVKSWSGCTPSADLRTCSVAGTGDTVASVTFQPGPAPGTSYTLAVRFLALSGTVTGGGIDCVNGTGTCSAQMTGPVTLTALPDAGYSVKSWSGCTPSADLSTCSVAPTGSTAVSVAFQSGPPTATAHTLNVRMLSASGTVTGGGISCTDNTGACSAQMTGPLTLTAQPATGYSVKSWSGCTASADLSTCGVDGTADTAVAITFQSGPPAGTPHTLNVRMLSTSGTVTGGGISCTNNTGTCSATITGPVTLVAQPDASFSVKSWSGCAPSADLSTCGVAGTSDAAVSITFQSGPPAGSAHTLNLRVLAPSGTVTGGGLSCTDNGGTCSAQITGPVTLTARPATGYSVASWSGCTPGADLSNCSVAGTSDAAVGISFQSGPPAPTPHTLNVRVLSVSGAVTGGGISCTNNVGTCSAQVAGPVTLTALPAPGYAVKSWSGCTASADLSSCSVAGTADTAVSIAFQ